MQAAWAQKAEELHGWQGLEGLEVFDGVMEDDWGGEGMLPELCQGFSYFGEPCLREPMENSAFCGVHAPEFQGLLQTQPVGVGGFKSDPVRTGEMSKPRKRGRPKKKRLDENGFQGLLQTQAVSSGGFLSKPVQTGEVSKLPKRGRPRKWGLGENATASKKAKPSVESEVIVEVKETDVRKPKKFKPAQESEMCEGRTFSGARCSKYRTPGSRLCHHHRRLEGGVGAPGKRDPLERARASTPASEYSLPDVGGVEEQGGASARDTPPLESVQMWVGGGDRCRAVTCRTGGRCVWAATSGQDFCTKHQQMNARHERKEPIMVERTAERKERELIGAVESLFGKVGPKSEGPVGRALEMYLQRARDCMGDEGLFAQGPAGDGLRVVLRASLVEKVSAVQASAFGLFCLVASKSQNDFHLSVGS
jgi:hypothetical protein